ncbi:alanine and glycine-rich protein-like [Caloenas nicobarica]|uniref:alanine and glycine-rich protein-like n=1 Tax=Caloenas nicobarica TaxID=187106 RepID=UPI0032B72787
MRVPAGGRERAALRAAQGPAASFARLSAAGRPRDVPAARKGGCAERPAPLQPGSRGARTGVRLGPLSGARLGREPGSGGTGQLPARCSQGPGTARPRRLRGSVPTADRYAGGGEGAGAGACSPQSGGAGYILAHGVFRAGTGQVGEGHSGLRESYVLLEV